MIKRLLKSFRVAILFFCLSSLYLVKINASQSHEFQITKDIYKTSELYQILPINNGTYPGTIKKSAFRIRTNYDLSDKHGWQATGITRLFSAGSIFNWAKQIDIYDTRGIQIALIDGKTATLEAARFDLYQYDDAGNYTLVGSAYTDYSFNHFTIFSSQNEVHPIAVFNRNYNNNSWTASIQYPEKIDERLVRILAGFIIDHEDKFLNDNTTG